MQISFGFILITIFIILVIYRVVFVSKKPKLTAPCPKCKAVEVIETNRETIATRTVQSFGGGTGLGSSVRLQLDLDLTFRCQKCEHKFSQAFTETQ